MSRKNRVNDAATAARTAYEGTVIVRAVERAGRNPQLKGHIHEVLVKDLRNLRNLADGGSTELTRSSTARAVDLVTVRGGKVVERMQLKDAPASVGKIVRQARSGQYRSAQLLGTEETARAFNRAARAQGVAKTMRSSGVSSRTTESLAQRAGAAGSGTLGGAVSRAAASGGAVGAVVGGSVELVCGVVDLIDGRRDVGEVAGAVARAGVKGGASGAAASAAATATGAAVATGLGAAGITGVTAVATTVALPLVVAVGVGYVVSELFDWLFD